MIELYQCPLCGEWMKKNQLICYGNHTFLSLSKDSETRVFPLTKAIQMLIQNSEKGTKRWEVIYP